MPTANNSTRKLSSIEMDGVKEPTGNLATSSFMPKYAKKQPRTHAAADSRKLSITELPGEAAAAGAQRRSDRDSLNSLGVTKGRVMPIAVTYFGLWREAQTGGFQSATRVTWQQKQKGVQVSTQVAEPLLKPRKQ